MFWNAEPISTTAMVFPNQAIGGLQTPLELS